MEGNGKIVRKAEKLVETMMKGNDASHDASHAFRVRDLALFLAAEEGLSSSPSSLLIVELAALLHDIGDYKYTRDPADKNIIENFLNEEGLDESKKKDILSIINQMGFKDELGGPKNIEHSSEFGVVQDADRLDAIGAIGVKCANIASDCSFNFSLFRKVSSSPSSSGIARCFTFGGSRNNALHDPAVLPRNDLSKEQYQNKDKNTTINHFHEKLLKLKDMMKTEAGRRRADRRHKFMVDFLNEFYEEWDGRA